MQLTVKWHFKKNKTNVIRGAKSTANTGATITIRNRPEWSIKVGGFDETNDAQKKKSSIGNFA